MQFPTVSATYIAVLALLYAVLGLHVVSLRRRNSIRLGDGGNERLRVAIRVHGHFAEYVPLIGLMAALLEMSGAPPIRMHAVMGALLVSRLLHAVGMYGMPGTLRFKIGRVGGMALTIAVMVLCAVQLLGRTLTH